MAAFIWDKWENVDAGDLEGGVEGREEEGEEEGWEGGGEEGGEEDAAITRVEESAGIS